MSNARANLTDDDVQLIQKQSNISEFFQESQVEKVEVQEKVEDAQPWKTQVEPLRWRKQAAAFVRVPGILMRQTTFPTADRKTPLTKFENQTNSLVLLCKERSRIAKLLKEIKPVSYDCEPDLAKVEVLKIQLTDIRQKVVDTTDPLIAEVSDISLWHTARNG